jgi:hypothetical protein
MNIIKILILFIIYFLNNMNSIISYHTILPYSNNIKDLNNTKFFLNRKIKMQRIISDIDIYRKNIKLLDNIDVYNIINEWIYNDVKCIYKEKIYNYLNYYYNDNNKIKNIGIFNYSNDCECILLYTYKNNILFLNYKILNPKINDINIINAIHLKILNYNGNIFKENINNIIN